MFWIKIGNDHYFWHILAPIIQSDGKKTFLQKFSQFRTFSSAQFCPYCPVSFTAKPHAYQDDLAR